MKGLIQEKNLSYVKYVENTSLLDMKEDIHMKKILNAKHVEKFWPENLLFR